MKRKKKLLSLMFALLIVAGVTFGIVHQQQVKAERIAQEEREAEKKLLKITTAAVDTAYQTRSDKDIEIAETALSKLATQQKVEHTKLTNKLSQLKSFLKQISDVNAALSKAIQSKTEQDIKATQTLIDKETDAYLKNDKAEAQNKLNALSAQITKEKAEKEAKAKADAAAAKAAADAAEVPRQADAVVQASNQPAYNEAPQQYYQQPAQDNGGSYTQPTSGSGYMAPAQAPAPEPPQLSGGPVNDMLSPIKGGPSGWASQNNDAMVEYK